MIHFVFILFVSVFFYLLSIKLPWFFQRKPKNLDKKPKNVTSLWQFEWQKFDNISFPNITEIHTTLDMVCDTCFSYTVLVRLWMPHLFYYNI